MKFYIKFDSKIVVELIFLVFSRTKRRNKERGYTMSLIVAYVTKSLWWIIPTVAILIAGDILERKHGNQER